MLCKYLIDYIVYIMLQQRKSVHIFSTDAIKKKKNYLQARCQWLTPINLPTQKTNSLRDAILKKTFTKRAGGVAQVGQIF
jgi:hypothetical protein